jgi:hypothetical protein
MSAPIGPVTESYIFAQEQRICPLSALYAQEEWHIATIAPNRRRETIIRNQASDFVVG